MAQRFSQDHIFGIGQSVTQFLHNFKTEQLPWYKCGPKSAGNGALMRIAPMIMPHLRSGTSNLWAETALSAMITHNDSASTAACLAFVNMLWQLLQMDTVPAAQWWLDSYVSIARELETGTAYRPRSINIADYAGPVWQFVEEKVNEADRRNLSSVEACNSWHSGAYLLETVPSVIYILMRYSHNLEEALIRSINDTWDNDTIAAIVGAAVGALHGKSKISQRWLSGLLGRTTDRDDGQIFRLIDRTRQLWWQ